MVLTDRATTPEGFLVDHFAVDHLVHESVVYHSGRHVADGTRLILSSLEYSHF